METSSSVTLSPLWIEYMAIGLEAKIPAHGCVRTPFCISYLIKNHSDCLVTLRLSMEGSDAFMFAGQKQVQSLCLYLIACMIFNDSTIYFQLDIYILPKDVRKVDWVLRPLVAGFVALPILSLTIAAGNVIFIKK